MKFGTLDISYDERVLRPRPWTEQQAHWAAQLLTDPAPAGPVLELCAGAGQIGLLTISLQPRPLVCVDRSPMACGFARSNAAAAGLGSLVDVREASLESALAPGERFALVIADPPWVPSDRTGAFPEDPLEAIDGGLDGLDVARACLRTAIPHLLPGAAVLLQLGAEDQAAALAEEFDELVVRETRRCEGGVLVHLTLPSPRSRPLEAGTATHDHLAPSRGSGGRPRDPAARPR
ncbi:methyltransferase [Nocardioides panacihumi]